jgi:hypothetical protein
VRGFAARPEVTTLVNPLASVEWNLHKRYLLDLLESRRPDGCRQSWSRVGRRVR